MKEKRFENHEKKVCLKTNGAWLEGTIELSMNKQNRPIRLSKSSKESSERTKRKTEEIRSVPCHE